jgi:hypothetical protein
MLPRWQDSAGLEETTLLRLALLRDLIRRLHAEKSACMARGQKAESQAFGETEKRLTELRGAATLDAPLDELLLRTSPIRRRTRLLPEALHSFIPKDRFDRYDRQWETAIAAEALSQGWRFWMLDAWVRIADAEEWHHQLGEHLHPHGLILFAESAPDALAAHAPPDLWHGQWHIVLKPRFLTPDFRVQELSGTSDQPQPPRWRLLYSPPHR